MSARSPRQTPQPERPERPEQRLSAGTDPLDPAELTRIILGEAPEHTAAEVATSAAISVEQARRLWRALGFPEAEGDAAVYTPSDAKAIRTLVESVRTGTIDLDLAVNLTRALGQNMARLADWEVGALVHRVEQVAEQESRDGGSADTDGSVVRGTMAIVEELSGGFEQLMVYAWRRHLAAAIGRVMALGDADPHTTRLTVGFADIVSFTALSNEISRDRIGDLVEKFESRCADVVASRRGRIIKSIGDSVLFVHDDPVRAYDIAAGIIQVIGRDPRMPDVRVGLATGSVVARLGDVFGPPVNMAARLTNVARRNRVIVDAETASLLPSTEFETRALPARPVRGFGVIEPVAVRRH